jgi:hypothetical protein
MVKQFERFLGKVCTVLTQSVSFPFTNPRQHAEYFTGIVKEVNTYGILIEHPKTNDLAFFSFPVVGIVEEQAVAKNDPNYEKIREEIEQKQKPKAVPKPLPPNYLSLEDMTAMAKQAKEKINKK